MARGNCTSSPRSCSRVFIAREVRRWRESGTRDGLRGEAVRGPEPAYWQVQVYWGTEQTNPHVSQREYWRDVSPPPPARRSCPPARSRRVSRLRASFLIPVSLFM